MKIEFIYTYNEKPQFNLKESIKDEWIMKEWGSYEDSNEADSHIVAILKRSPKNKVVANSLDELITIKRSAWRNNSGSWNTGNPIVEKLMKSCDRILKSCDKFIPKNKWH